MADRIDFRYSSQKQLGLLLVSCVLVAGSWFVATHSADVVHRTICWFGVPFFSLCGIIAVKRMLSGGTPFFFDRSGIGFPAGSFGLLPWSEIKSYGIVTIHGNQFLALTFHDPERALSRVPTFRRKWALGNERLGWGHWALTFTGVTPGIEEALAFMREHSGV